MTVFKVAEDNAALQCHSEWENPRREYTTFYDSTCSGWISAFASGAKP